MARSDPQLNFRIPAELKERLESAAKESGRSLNSELITRLRSTFEDTPSGNAAARVYVLIDSAGIPQSWAEINEYLGAIQQAGGIRAARLDTHVITPDLVSSQDRLGEAAALAQYLRQGGRSLAGSAPEWNELTSAPPAPKAPSRTKKGR